MMRAPRISGYLMVELPLFVCEKTSGAVCAFRSAQLSFTLMFYNFATLAFGVVRSHVDRAIHQV